MTTFDAWEASIYHSGILGMKWGVRRYQNKDGTLTELGKRRYGTAENFNRIQRQNKKAKYMTDEELRQNTARLEAEKRYNDLKNSRNGVGLASKLIDTYNRYSDRKEEKEKRELERLKTTSQTLQAKYKADEARQGAKKAKEEKKKAVQEKRLYKTDAKKKEIKTKYLQAKDQRSKNTIRGGIAKHLHDKFANAKKESRKERALGRELAIKNLQVKISDIDNFGSLTMEEVEERAIAKANRRRKH